MPHASEREMYPEVVKWLNEFLSTKFPKARIEVADTSKIALKDFIARRNLQTCFRPEWVSYDLQVDVTGVALSKNAAQLAVVECKTVPLTLAHTSQLLGYSRVALPLFSFLVSPQGYSDALTSLLKTYSRTDVLEYYWERGKSPRTLILATWDSRVRSIEPSTILPSSAITIWGTST